MDVGEQLQALADPTRRAIFDIVRARSSSVREITDELPISQPAVSQHLKVLRTARLVTVTTVGRRRIYRADRRGLAVLREWIDALWDDPLDAFADAAESTPRTTRSTP
jgi:DNA-binding transcriptional ArsR family regulator